MPPTPKNSVPTFQQKPEVVFQPRTARGFQGGINKIVEAIRPSLGPFPRAVVIDRFARARAPELLDSGGVIARRIIALPNRDEDAGAMYLRGALWNLHEQAGDGVATSAVIFQSIFNEGLKFIAAGGNAMQLRSYLDKGSAIIAAALDAVRQPIAGAEALIGVAKTVCSDVELAKVLGETASIVGEFGLLEIRAGRGRSIERELVTGSYWPAALITKGTTDGMPQPRVVFENAAILLTDLAIENPQELIPVLQAAVEAKVRRLVVVCSQAAAPVQGVLNQSRNSEKLQIIAVKTPGLHSDVQMTNLIDMAVLTGGKVLVKAAGDTLAGVRPDHFGYARTIWANNEYTGLNHPQGDPKGIRTHINTLRAAFKNAKKAADRQRLQERIGTLLGGAATINVGGLTETEMAVRKELAKRTADALRGAAREGVLPGGGSALLACRAALGKLLEGSDSPEARAAHRILTIALEVPFRALMTNSGHNAGQILSAVEQAGPGFGFDLVTGQVCEMLPNGIVDVASVQKQAVISAIHGAALALTVDILIHRDKPPMVVEPDAPGL